ncbi:MAG: epoxyqueuosine reductase QueH, partial [Thermoplasmata archaeon]|nr:epoxyqueuosine reductase QueH [Thermoplasmata archaeon]
IKKVGKELEKKYGIKFYYEDFRQGWKQGKEIAKVYSLYSQKYCGCLISEWERFGKKSI